MAGEDRKLVDQSLISNTDARHFSPVKTTLSGTFSALVIISSFLKEIKDITEMKLKSCHYFLQKHFHTFSLPLSLKVVRLTELKTDRMVTHKNK